MEFSGVADQQAVNPEAFWSSVSGVLGGLNWVSMQPGVRKAWLAALSNVDGAVAACRAEAISHNAGHSGAAERTAELVRATGMSGRDAATEVKTADTLADAPAVVEALASGAITKGHVDAIVRDLPVSHRAAALADPAVLAAASTESVDGFKADMRSWRSHHDNDLDGRRLAAHQHANRRASISTAPDGMVHFQAALAPEAGAIVSGAIHKISQRLWRDEDDRAPDPADPARGRTAAQRTADALRHMAELVNSGHATSGPPRVDLVAIFDYDRLVGELAGQATTRSDGDFTARATGRLAEETAGRLAGQTASRSDGTVTGITTGKLAEKTAGRSDNSVSARATGRATRSGRCETSDGTPLAPATVRRLACDAGIIPAVIGGNSQVLDLGRRTRTVSTAQRNALTARDGGCVFPGCDRPPSWCDAHHVIHWLNQGPTDLWNLALLCSAHHHAVHEGGWQLTHANRRTPATSPLVFTDPAGRQLAPEPPAARHHQHRELTGA